MGGTVTCESQKCRGFEPFIAIHCKPKRAPHEDWLIAWPRSAFQEYLVRCAIANSLLKMIRHPGSHAADTGNSVKSPHSACGKRKKREGSKTRKGAGKERKSAENTRERRWLMRMANPWHHIRATHAEDSGHSNYWATAGAQLFSPAPGSTEDIIQGLIKQA